MESGHAVRFVLRDSEGEIIDGSIRRRLCDLPPKEERPAGAVADRVLVTPAPRTSILRDSEEGESND